MLLFSHFYESQVKDSPWPPNSNKLNNKERRTRQWCSGESVKLWEHEVFLENIGLEVNSQWLTQRGNWGGDNLSRSLKHTQRAQKWQLPDFSGMKKTVKCPHCPGYSADDYCFLQRSDSKSICFQGPSPSKKNDCPFLWVNRCVFLHLWMFNLSSQATSFMLLEGH